MILIDSNIIVYSLNRSSPKHKKAQRFIQDNIDKLVVAHQNIFEVLRVLTHRKFMSPMSPSAAIKSVSAIVEHAITIYPSLQTHFTALALIKKHQLHGNLIFDAYLTATMIDNGITAIVTDNEKDFARFEGINIVNPF